MAMVQVIDDPDIGDVSFLQTFDDGDLVLRLSEPGAVIVERDRATNPGGGFADRLYARRLSFNPCFLLRRIPHRVAAPHYPKLRADFVPFENLEDQPRFVVHGAREPPGHELDVVPLESLHLRVERGDRSPPPLLSVCPAMRFVAVNKLFLAESDLSWRGGAESPEAWFAFPAWPAQARRTPKPTAWRSADTRGKPVVIGSSNGSITTRR